MYIEVNGKTVKNTGKVLNNGVMEPNFKACINMIGNMALAHFVLQTDLNIPASSKTG